MSYPVQVAYECSNAGKPSASLQRIRVISGGGCHCDAVKVTISTGQPAKSHYALVRVTGWDHNADCKRRSGVQKLLSPSAAALLEDIVKRNIGKTNIDLMVMYMREIARPYMSKLSMTYEEISNFWAAHPAKAPRDADISAAVCADSTTARARFCLLVRLPVTQGYVNSSDLLCSLNLLGPCRRAGQRHGRSAAARQDQSAVGPSCRSLWCAATLEIALKSLSSCFLTRALP